MIVTFDLLALNRLLLISFSCSNSQFYHVMSAYFIKCGELERLGGIYGSRSVHLSLAGVPSYSMQEMAMLRIKQLGMAWKGG